MVRYCFIAKKVQSLGAFEGCASGRVIASGVMCFGNVECVRGRRPGQFLAG